MNTPIIGQPLMMLTAKEKHFEPRSGRSLLWFRSNRKGATQASKILGKSLRWKLPAYNRRNLNFLTWVRQRANINPLSSIRHSKMRKSRARWTPRLRISLITSEARQCRRREGTNGWCLLGKWLQRILFKCLQPVRWGLIRIIIWKSGASMAKG